MAQKYQNPPPPRFPVGDQANKNINPPPSSVRPPPPPAPPAKKSS